MTGLGGSGGVVGDPAELGAAPGMRSPEAAGELEDDFASRPVSAAATEFIGMKWDVVADSVALPGGAEVRREYVKHPGAVSVVALGEDGRVLLLRQYRHPVRMRLWELPAGLLDEEGESPAVAAARELWEEVDLRAERFDVLVDFFSSPGMGDEAHRVFLARGLTEVPADEQHLRVEEEADIVTRWVDLDSAVEAVLDGRLHNPALCVGLLAAARARDLGWSTLRPADTPWPHHPRRRPALVPEA